MHKRRETRGLTSVGKQVCIFLCAMTIVALIALPKEPWIGQRQPSQPHSWMVHLEEAQYPQSPPLPVIGISSTFLYHARFSTVFTIRSCRFMFAMDVCAYPFSRKNLALGLSAVLSKPLLVGVTFDQEF